MRAAFICLLSLLFSAEAFAEAAIAVGKNSWGAWGYAFQYNASDAAAAKRYALRACRKAGFSYCTITAEFNDLCFAFHMSSNGGMYIGYDQDQQTAIDKSAADCTSNTYGCYFTESHCDTVNQARIAQERQRFEDDWGACFGNTEDTLACDRAAAYPYILSHDSQRIAIQKTAIAIAQREREAAAAHERTAQAERERETAERQARAEALAREQAERRAAIAAREAKDAEILRVLGPPNCAVGSYDLCGFGLVPLQEWITTDDARYSYARTFSEKTGLEVFTALIALVLLSLLPLLWKSISRIAANASDQWGGGVRPVQQTKGTTALALVAPTPVKPAEAYQTEAAVQAMELAYSYLQEDADTIGTAAADEFTAKMVMDNLALITKQIRIAEKNDPTAKITIEVDEEPIPYGLTELKAQALFHETYARIGTNDSRRAIRCLEQAIVLKPDNPGFYMLLGTIYAGNNQKRKAVAALEQAVALAPKEIEIRKALDRARNMSGAAIALDKAFKIGRTGVKVGVGAGRLVVILFLALPFITMAAGYFNGEPHMIIVGFGILMVYGMFMSLFKSVRDWFRSSRDMF